MAHFAIKGAHAETDETRELAKDAGAEGTEQAIGVSEDEAIIVGRFGARSRDQARRRGDGGRSTPARCISSTRRPVSESTTPRKEQHSVKKHRLVIAAAARRGAARGRRRVRQRKAAKKSAVSGNVNIVGVWTGERRSRSTPCSTASGRRTPTSRSATSRRATTRRPCSRLRSPAATRRTSRRSSQPGLVNDFQKKGALKNIDYAKGALSANYPPDIAKIGEIKGHVYGLLIKGANKSTVWYNVASFKNAGVKAPTTLPAFRQGTRTR